MESQQGAFHLCFGEEANRSIYKAYCIKLVPFVSNIYVPKYWYRFGISHFYLKSISIRSVAKQWYRCITIAKSLSLFKVKPISVLILANYLYQTAYLKVNWSEGKFFLAKFSHAMHKTSDFIFQLCFAYEF